MVSVDVNVVDKPFRGLQLWPMVKLLPRTTNSSKLQRGIDEVKPKRKRPPLSG